MVYDHCTVSIIYDNRPLETKRPSKNSIFHYPQWMFDHLVKFTLLLIYPNINIMIVGFNNLIYVSTKLFHSSISIIYQCL